MPDSFAQLAAAYAQLASSYAALAARQPTPLEPINPLQTYATGTVTTVSGNRGPVSGGRVPKVCGCDLLVCCSC